MYEILEGEPYVSYLLEASNFNYLRKICNQTRF